MVKFKSSLPTDPWWRSKLDTVQKLASQGDEGDLFFLQVTSYPITRMYLRTGKVFEFDNTKREVHMSMQYQPDYYTPKPRGMEAIIEEGYKRQVERCVQLHQADSTKIGKTVIPLKKWNELYMRVCNKIGDAIRIKHGIKCYEDGDLENENAGNIIYMHPCDVINIALRKHLGMTKPRVVIRTSLMEEIENKMVDIVTSKMLDEEEKAFLYTEHDAIYLMFCYYGNTSQLPIRLQVEENGTLFPNSKFFMNDEHFFTQQLGKLQELNRTETHIICSITYRSR